MNKEKTLFLYVLLFMILTFFGIYLYGFIHESAHFLACKSLGISAEITIDLFRNPPLFLTTCPEAVNLPAGGLFIIRSAPYLLSALIMLIILVFFKPLNIYYLFIPLAILLSDWFNLFIPLLGSISFPNDFIQIAFLPNKFYSVLISVLLASTTLFCWLIIKNSFWREKQRLKSERFLLR